MPVSYLDNTLKSHPSARNSHLCTLNNSCGSTSKFSSALSSASDFFVVTTKLAFSCANFIKISTSSPEHIVIHWTKGNLHDNSGVARVILIAVWGGGKPPTRLESYWF